MLLSECHAQTLRYHSPCSNNLYAYFQYHSTSHSYCIVLMLSFSPTLYRTHLTHTALFSCFLSHPPYTVHISLILHYSHAFFLSHPPYTLHISLILHCLYQHMRRETKTNGHHAFIIFFFSFFFFHFVIFIGLKCITFI